MEFHINFQYRPKDSHRPLDEQMLDGSGNPLNLIHKDAGLLPNIGDHVIFCYASGRKTGPNPLDYESITEQVQGIVENRLFVYLSQKMVAVNIVVTDSNINSGLLIKE